LAAPFPLPNDQAEKTLRRVISLSTILLATLPIYGIALLGAFLRRVRVIVPEMDAGIMKLTIHCLYPCLILDKMLGNAVLRDPAVVGWGIGLGFLLITVGLALAYAVGRLIGLLTGSGLRTFALTSGMQNYGYLAVPILMALFPSGGALGVLFVHNLGVEIAIWTVGLMLLTGTTLKSPKRLLNGPIVAVVVGLLLVASGGDAAFDSQTGAMAGKMLRTVINYLGVCAFPIALLQIGTVIFDLIGKERLSLRISLGGMFVRLVMLPVVFILAARYLPIALQLKQVLIVQAAMPSAVFPIMMARFYGGRPGVAVEVVLATSAASLVFMPLIIRFGMAWVAH
jgi:predicted permease